MTSKRKDLSPITHLVDEVAELGKRVDKVGRGTPLTNASIDSGDGITVMGPDGETLIRIGPDGHGGAVITYPDGPIPATPEAPVVTGGTGVAWVQYTGDYVGGAPRPTDLLHVQVHVAPAGGVESDDDENPVEDAAVTSGPDFTPGAGTLAGVITSRDGGAMTAALDAGAWWVRLVAESLGGRVSAPSVATRVTVEALIDDAAIGEAMAELDERLEQAGTDLAEARDRIAQTEEDLSEASARLDAVGQDLAQTGAELTTRLETAETDLADARGALTNLEDVRLPALAQDLADAAATAEAGRAALAGQVGAAQQDIANAKGDLANLKNVRLPGIDQAIEDARDEVDTKLGKVEAEMLLISPGELCPDPYFDRGSEFWAASFQYSAFTPAAAFPQHPQGSEIDMGAAGVGTVYAHLLSTGHMIPVVPGEAYEGYAWVYSTDGLTGLTNTAGGRYNGVNLQLYAYANNSQSGGEISGGRPFIGDTGSVSPTFPAKKWVKVGGQFIVPEGTYWISPRVTIYQGATNSNTGKLYVGHLSVRKAVGATLIEDGAIKTRNLDAEEVAAGLGEFIDVKASHIVGDTAALDTAFIHQMVGDKAFLSEMYANRVVVDTRDYVGTRGSWELGAKARFETPSGSDQSGMSIAIGRTGTDADRTALGPIIYTPAGTSIVANFRCTYNAPTNTDLWRAEMVWINSSGVEVSRSLIYEAEANVTIPATVITAPSGTTHARLALWASAGTLGERVFRNLNVRVQASSVEIANGAVKADQVDAQSVAGAVGTFVKANVSKLVADTATMSSAVVEKLFSEVVAAKKISVEELQVGNLTNLYPDDQLTRPGIRNPAASGNAIGYATIAGTGPGVPTGQKAVTLRRTADTTPDRALYFPHLLPDYFIPVTPGETYRIVAKVKTPTTATQASSVQMRVYTYTSRDATPVNAGAGGNLATMALNTWYEFGGLFTVPDGVNYINPRPTVYYAGSTALDTALWYVTAPKVVRATGGELLVDGAVTARHVTASESLSAKIASFLQLDVSKLVASSATLDEAVINKLWLGILSARNIIADAVNGHVITGSTIQTVTTAARGVKLDGTGLHAYNTSGAQTFSVTTAGVLTATGAHITGSITGSTISGGTVSGTEITGSRFTYDGVGAASGYGVRIANDTNGAYIGLTTDASIVSATIRTLDDDTYKDYDNPVLVLRPPSRGSYVNRNALKLFAGSGQSLGGADFTGDVIVRGHLRSRSNGDTDHLRISDFDGDIYDGAITIKSLGVFRRIYTQAANVYVTSNGYLGRSTSLRKFKEDIEDLPQTQVDALLNVKPRWWFDKGDVDRMSNAMTPTLQNEENSGPTPEVPRIVTRVPGVVAEEVEEAGATAFLTKDIREGEEVLTGVAYDRIGAALLGVVKELRDTVRTQAEQIDQLTQRLDQLTQQ